MSSCLYIFRKQAFRLPSTDILETLQYDVGNLLFWWFPENAPKLTMDEKLNFTKFRTEYQALSSHNEIIYT